MDTLPTFSGFPQAGIEVLANLAAHNNRVWFEAHQKDYQALLAFPCSGVCHDAGSEIAEAFAAIRVQTERAC